MGVIDECSREYRRPLSCRRDGTPRVDRWRPNERRGYDRGQIGSSHQVLGLKPKNIFLLEVVGGARELHTT